MMESARVAQVNVLRSLHLLLLFEMLLSLCLDMCYLLFLYRLVVLYTWCKVIDTKLNEIRVRTVTPPLLLVAIMTLPAVMYHSSIYSGDSATATVTGLANLLSMGAPHVGGANAVDLKAAVHARRQDNQMVADSNTAEMLSSTFFAFFTLTVDRVSGLGMLAMDALIFGLMWLLISSQPTNLGSSTAWRMVGSPTTHRSDDPFPGESIEWT